MTILDDLTRTLECLARGWSITAITRAKRAQEEQAMENNDDETQDLARAALRIHAMAHTLAVEIQRYGGSPSIGCHRSTALARAALLLPGAERMDVEPEDREPFTTVTVGAVKFFAGVVL